MQVPLVMTVIGKDRPGLVELVSGKVAEHGGNWLESRMCRLGGEFAGIVRVSIPSQTEQALDRALAELGSQGLTVVVRQDFGEAAATGGARAIIEVVGQDRPGIVRQISHALAERGVNVEELESECGSAPMSGETLFKARIDVLVPAGCDTGALRGDLERIANDLFIDITFAPLPANAEASACCQN